MEGEPGFAVFCDIKADDEFGVVSLVEEPATEPLVLSKETWRKAQKLAEFVKSTGDHQCFFTWGLFRVGVTDLKTQGYLVEHEKELQAFVSENKDFLPALWSKVEQGDVKVEVHSLGLILPGCSETMRSAIEKETISDDFSLFAASLVMLLSKSKWQVPDASKKFEFRRCLMTEIEKSPLSYTPDVEIHEIPVRLPFRERFGWFANHCEKQLKFVQAHALGCGSAFLPRVLYFGTDTSLTKELDTSAFGLDPGQIARLERKLKQNHWRRTRKHYWRKESLFLLLSVGGSVQIDLIACLEKLLDELYVVKPKVGTANLRGFGRNREEMLANIERGSTIIDLRDNWLSWLSDAKYVREIDLSSVNLLNLASNNLFGPKFVQWLFEILSKNPNLSVDISGTPQANGWTPEAWEIFDGNEDLFSRIKK